MKFPITVQAVRISKLGEFVADERVLNSNAELEAYHQTYSQFTIVIKKRRRKRNSFVRLFRMYWWALVILVMAMIILAIERRIL